MAYIYIVYGNRRHPNGIDCKNDISLGYFSSLKEAQNAEKELRKYKCNIYTKNGEEEVPLYNNLYIKAMEIMPLECRSSKSSLSSISLGVFGVFVVSMSIFISINFLNKR